MSNYQVTYLVFMLAPRVCLSCVKFDHTPFSRPPLYFSLSVLLWLPHHGCALFPCLFLVLLDMFGSPLVSTTGAQRERAEFRLSCSGGACTFPSCWLGVCWDHGERLPLVGRGYHLWFSTCVSTLRVTLSPGVLFSSSEALVRSLL